MKGKHVFLTGASRGLGKSMAVAYAKAGASIIGISARSNLDEVAKELEGAAQSSGWPIPTVVAVEMDVSNEASVHAAMAQVSKEFDGRLDILINNAGYMETWRPIAEMNVEDWWKSWDVNIKGQVLVWKAMLPLLLASEHGLKTMVNLSSIGAHMSSAGASAYGTAKFALLRLTEILNVENAQPGLIAYCMHPGAVPTDLSEKMPDYVKVNLIDTPELMADTVVFLTQERREWLRGRYLSCNWDMPELLSMEEEIIKGDKLKMRMCV